MEDSDAGGWSCQGCARLLYGMCHRWQPSCTAPPAGTAAFQVDQGLTAWYQATQPRASHAQVLLLEGMVLLIWGLCVVGQNEQKAPQVDATMHKLPVVDIYCLYVAVC